MSYGKWRQTYRGKVLCDWEPALLPAPHLDDALGTAREHNGKFYGQPSHIPVRSVLQSTAFTKHSPTEARGKQPLQGLGLSDVHFLHEETHP